VALRNNLILTFIGNKYSFVTCASNNVVSKTKAMLSKEMNCLPDRHFYSKQI
jgi:hypothetical protein